jgi:hypothetical protein
MAPFLAPLLVSLAQVSAQSPAAAAPPPTVTQQFTSRRGGRLFISPMGEPFRANGREDDGLADWFAQADTNHDGHLTLDEMQKDAERFFATLDIGKDGEIDPDDITRYETQIAPEIQSGARFGLASLGSEGSERDAAGGKGGWSGGRGGGGGGHRRGGQGRASAGLFHVDKDQHQGAGRYGLLDLPEPVVSADADFNRGVSLNEFRFAAQQRFLALDLDHHGYLTLPALESIRPAPPPQPNKPEEPKDMPLPSPQL